MSLTKVKTKTVHYFKDKDGKLQGESKSWYSNSRQLMQHSFHKDGKLQGEYKRRWCNGQLWEHSFHKDGKKQGECKQWDRNGQLDRHSFYKDGKKVIDFIDNPELYPVANEDKTMFTLKYGSAKWL